MKELLKNIGINKEGQMSSNNNYVIDFSSVEEYNRAFSKLDKSDIVTENEDASVINVSVSNIMYSNEDFSLNLIADFDNDSYKLVVTELKEKN